MRSILILLLVIAVGGCSGPSETDLPVAGSLAVKKDNASERYQVTWSGTSTYNQGACDVNQLCVHLIRTVQADNRVEIAVSLAYFNQQFRRLD